LLDADGDVLLANSLFEVLSGYNDQTWLELDIRDLLLTPDGEQNPFEGKSLLDFKRKMFLLTANKSILPVHADQSEIEGQKYLVLITKQLIPKDEKPESGSLNEKTNSRPQNKPVEKTDQQLAKSISHEINVSEGGHEIRTALNGMLGFAESLLQETVVASDQKVKKTVQNLLKSGQKLKQILIGKESDILSSNVNLNLSIVNPADVIKKLIDKHMDNTAGIEVPVIWTESALPSLLSDIHRLNKIIDFFITKAIAYTRTSEVKLLTAINKESSCFEVQIDNIGLDFPYRVVEEINRQNETSKFNINAEAFDEYPEIKGLLKELIALEAGLRLDEGDHMGLIPTLSFNSCFVDGAADAEEVLEKKLSERQPSVLIVEDDKFNAAVLKIYLSKLNKVVFAHSGNEALNILERSIASGLHLDLIIMDIGLPDPWNGILLKQEILKKWSKFASVPIICHTAFTDDEMTAEVEIAGFQAVLTKPVRRIELLHIMNKLLTTS
jgi:CheY-like chemotaxis protein